MVKNLMSIEISRNGSVKLKLSVCDEIKHFYKIMNPDVKSGAFSKFSVNGSTTFNYLKLPVSENNNSEYMQFLSKYSLRDDSTEEQLSNFDRVNLAFMRIAAANPDTILIELPRVISEDTVKDYIIKLKEAVLVLFKKFIRPVRISCTMTQEEVI